MELKKRIENALRIAGGIKEGMLEPNNKYDLLLHLTEAVEEAEKLKPFSKKVLLGSLNIGDKYKYELNDVGIFEVIAKERKHWVASIRTQNNRSSGDFPSARVYRV